jgi:hypothetical protein
MFVLMIVKRASSTKDSAAFFPDRGTISVSRAFKLKGAALKLSKRLRGDFFWR